jgi:hypothetical protein
MWYGKMTRHIASDVTIPSSHDVTLAVGRHLTPLTMTAPTAVASVPKETNRGKLGWEDPISPGSPLQVAEDAQGERMAGLVAEAEGSHTSSLAQRARKKDEDMRELLEGITSDFFTCPINTCLSPCPSSWTMYVLALSFGVAFCLDRVTDVLRTQVPGAATSYVRGASSACSAARRQGVLCAGGALPVSRAAIN